MRVKGREGGYMCVSEKELGRVSVSALSHCRTMYGDKLGEWGCVLLV